jgi:hypothetical protein
MTSPSADLGGADQAGQVGHPPLSALWYRADQVPLAASDVEKHAINRPVTAPGGRTTTCRLGRPSFVSDGESSTSSKPITSTKNLIAGSYSLTTTATRPRYTAPA